MKEPVGANPKNAGQLAQKVVAILVDADPETRRRVLRAVDVLLGDGVGGSPVDISDGDEPDGDLGKFFTRGKDLKPSDFAHLCGAYHFSRYGAEPFSVDEIREIAKEAGVTVPDRLDMTLVAAKRAGKKLFQRAGKGLFKPTAAASIVFKERWDVRPGKRAKQVVAKK